MDDSKSMVSSGAYGIPKWILKKGMRYEVDDFIVSPPSLDDGGFMRLRYGRTANHDSSSAAQGTSQDGGMTVEVKDDTLQFSSDSPPTTTISIGPGGLSVESSSNATPLATPETTAETATTTHPLLVLPMNFGGGGGEPKFVLKVDPPSSHNPNKDSLGPTAPQASKEAPLTVENRDKPHHSSHTSILDKIQSLSINTTPTSSSVTSPVTSPITTPKASPTFSRKIIAMEPQRRISAHSYFCTKQYMDRQTAMSIKEELPSPGNPKTVDEASLPPQALDSKMMGQRRRHPKPSALREMNFWAPTSM